MSLQVTILGSGGTIPTIERHLPAIAVKRMGKVFLFDCGEGTQRQLMKSKLGFGGLKAIFISHFHADHVLGLPGLLMTMNLMGIEQKIEIYGPKGIEPFVETALSLVTAQLRFPIQPKVLEPGIVFKGSDYHIETVSTNHSIPNFGFALIENKRSGRVNIEKAKEIGVPEGPLIGKLQRGESITLDNGQIVKPDEIVGSPRSGRKIVIALDTRPCESIEEFAKNADLFIYDGMFLDELKEEADLRGHSTLGDGAAIARRSKVIQLVYSHISPRYLGKYKMLQKTASRLFPGAVVARDMQKFDVSYPG